MRKGSFMRTSQGIDFYPLDPRPEDILIEDISHSLSLICRFNGHIRSFYSVAQHSLMVFYELKTRGYNDDICLYGLLHDASEAYLCDIPTPLKECLPDYQKIEKIIQDMIYTKFVGSIPTDSEHKIIKEVDNEALLFEATYLMTHNDWCWKRYDISYETLQHLGFNLQDVITPKAEYNINTKFRIEFENCMKRRSGK